MDYKSDIVYRRHLRNWKILQSLISIPVVRKFNMTHEDIDVEGPILLIPNHVSSWDPLLVSESLRHKQVYYVASEHLFRKGFLSKVLRWLVDPIPRSKGNAGMDTVRICLRHLRAGHSVCIFAEGEQSWDGRNGKVYPATGKLAKLSGATLVTYRIEGGYLSKPRWADTVRKGRVHGHPAGIYPPELLRTMSPEEIADIINRDISENAWERQKESPCEYRGKRLAEGLERVLYLCPSCKKTGTLTSHEDRLTCSCGLNVRYRTDGFFEPDTPFSDIAEWEDWQKQAIRNGDFVHGEQLFSDDGIDLIKISDHQETPIGRGRLVQYEDRLTLSGTSYSLSDIDSMAMTRTHILLFSSGGEYYQLSSKPGVNFRKYLELWKKHAGISN